MIEQVRIFQIDMITNLKLCFLPVYSFIWGMCQFSNLFYFFDKCDFMSNDNNE